MSENYDVSRSAHINEAKVYAGEDVSRASVELALKTHDNYLYQFKEARAIDLDNSEIEGAKLAPTLSISRDVAQGLINELWRLGFRPHDGTGSIAQVDAMREHINDLRNVAESLLDDLRAERDYHRNSSQ